MSPAPDMGARCAWVVDLFNRTVVGADARAIAYESDIMRFFQSGFTEDDFALVLNHICRTKATRPKQFRATIRLGKIVGDLRSFNDWMNDAKSEAAIAVRRAEARNTKQAKARALGFEMEPADKDRTRVASEVVAAGLRKLSEDLTKQK